jgi:HAD superfamily hydrolase (TIGR01662 family)
MQHELERYAAIFFDIDGTLADRDTHEVYPGVYDWFDEHGDNFKIALITNQGGVGLRYWMGSEGFGDPTKFPDEVAAQDHILQVIAQLPSRFAGHLHLNTYICYAYQSKKTGKWSPTPPGKEEDWQWSSAYRKPAPGMLRRAMSAFFIMPNLALMVGDGEEDEQAAQAAGCDFVWAHKFFKLPVPPQIES